MHVFIDSNKCQGHARCFMADPLTFDVDDYGFGVVIEDGTIPESRHESVRLAELNCPEQAIRITE